MGLGRGQRKTLSIWCSVDDIGDVTITNDGATILKLLEVQHPAAKVLVDLSDLQDKEVRYDMIWDGLGCVRMGMGCGILGRRRYDVCGHHRR